MVMDAKTNINPCTDPNPKLNAVSLLNLILTLQTLL